MLNTLRLPRPLRQQLERAGDWLTPYAEVPELSDEVYLSRAQQLERAREAAGLEALIIYADREHSANLLWLCGFAPRFEEALWVAVAGQVPVLLLGNENLGYAPGVLRLPARLERYAPFSLPDQDRRGGRSLTELLRGAGLEPGLKVGTVGWKPASSLEQSTEEDAGDGALELPHFIVQAIISVSGALPRNASNLLMHPQHGLRCTLEPEMVLCAEYAARLSSQAVLNVIMHLRPGQSEREAAGRLSSHGLELSAHPMVNFAPHIPSGLGSARNRPLTHLDYAQIGFGVQGGLTCRAGRVAYAGDADADGYAALLEGYLSALRAWCAALRIGVSGGEVVRVVEATVGDSWQLALNPGHLLHLEEWLGSPFTQGSPLRLRSGMALQQDLIPVPREGRACLNVEDGLLLANNALIGRLEELDPALLNRVNRRRKQMLELGYTLHPEVLPLSDLAGVCMPYLLEPDVLARLD